jgi:hypothetical protein
MRRLGMGKKQWVLYCDGVELKTFRTALNKRTMFVHVKRNLDFLERLS